MTSEEYVYKELHNSRCVDIVDGASKISDFR